MNFTMSIDFYLKGIFNNDEVVITSFEGVCNLHLEGILNA